MKKLLRFNNFFIIFTLLLASFLRLYRISDYMTFLGDEGRDMLVVYNILHGRFTFLGPTASVGGFFMGPVYYYFITPFLWLFNYDPVGPSVMVALIGVLTVYLVYKVGSDFFGKREGIIAALLYSISPLVIAYSRSSWNPNVVPFFSLLTMLIFYNAVRKKNMILFIFTGFLYGIDIQLHYIETFLGVVILVYVILSSYFEQKWNNKVIVKELVFNTLKNYILIFAGFISGVSPFLAFEVRHGFPNIQSIVKFVINPGEANAVENQNFFSIIGSVFFRLFARLLVNYPPQDQIFAGMHKNLLFLTIFTWIIAIASVSFFLYRFLQSYKEKKENFFQFLLLLVWFVIGMVLFGFYKKPIYDYYFGFLFPISFFFVGLLFSFLFFDLKKIIPQRYRGKIQTTVFFVFIWMIFINIKGAPFWFGPNKQKDQAREIAKFVLSKTENKPYNFALITRGNSDHAYRYYFKIEDRDPIIIENPQNDPKRESVTQQLLVICEDPQCEPLGNPIWEIAGYGKAEIAEKWDVSVVKVYKLIHYKGK